MAESAEELVSRMHREAAEGFRGQPLPEVKRPTIHYTQLPAGKPDSMLFQEWTTYRREVGHWLADGLENKWVLLKGEMAVGFFDTWEEARAEARKRFLLSSYLIHQIRAEEPVYRIREYC